MRIQMVLLLGCSMLVFGWQSVQAQQLRDDRAEASADQTESWSYDQGYPAKPDPKAIIQQKAQIRAAQRMSRMASMQWYGMSNARPTASATPFMGMYSPAWQMPGGRPFAWYHSQSSPVIIVR